jgi:signal transduction histidine kinase
MKSDTHRLTISGLNLIAQGLSIYDSNLKLVVSNSAFKSMFNLPDRFVTPGARFTDTIRHLAEHGEYGEIADLDKFVTEREDIARAFEPHYMERVRANGQTISVEGAPLSQGGWVAVYTDISPIKQQEAILRSRASELSEQVVDHAEALSKSNRTLAATNLALEEAKRLLTDSEARMRQTTEMMPAHIAHLDADERYTFSNRRLSAIVPGRPNDIVGLTCEEAIGASAYAAIGPSLAKAYRGRSSAFEFTHEESVRRIRVAFNPDGEGGVYLMSMDVTEETQARAALQQTRRREMAARITSGLGHDFSNLLTIILGLQSKLSRMPNLPAEAASLIASTQAAARRGGALLDGISNVTAARTSRPTALNVQGLMTDLAAMAASTLPDDIALNITCENAIPTVLLDAGQVQDCLLNLILNARDACGGQGHIDLAVRTVAETWLEFRVDDTGPGFAQDALARAFDPFFTTKGAEGSGLGLPMVYDITKLTGGDVRIANRPEGGARVTLRLPLRYAPETSGGLCLLVEDETNLRQHYRELLMDQGFSVIEAESADEALALLADLPDIALILSDLQLPGSADGTDLAERAGRNITTLLMTSLPAQDPLRQRALTLAPVLEKPFDAADLEQLLKAKAT